MHRATELLKIEQVLAQVAQKTTDLAERESANPVEEYLSPSRLEQETGLLFRQFPIAVGHVDQLKNPGDFFRHDATGVPLLICRDRSGTLHSFINICRHRGSRLVMEEQGNRKSFSCPYHSWTYALDGKLLGMPRPDAFTHIDRDTRGLVELPTAERFGLIWTRPSPGPAFDADQWFAPLAPDLEALNLDAMSVFKQKSVVRKMNWKLALDGFLEIYHFHHLHSKSAATLYADGIGATDDFYPHLRYFIARKSIVELRDLDREKWSLRQHALIAHYAFPCSFVQTLPDHFYVHSVFPVSADTCIFRHQMLIADKNLSEKATRYWTDNWQLVMDVFDEDFLVGESVQQGLAAGVNTHLIYGRCEQALTWVHRTINEALAGRLTVPSLP
jgi:phenylpropionate dioxygenase-like ring-hydroxylating dioxygenase large terminal subunit